MNTVEDQPLDGFDLKILRVSERSHEDAATGLVVTEMPSIAVSVFYIDVHAGLHVAVAHGRLLYPLGVDDRVAIPDSTREIQLSQF